MNANGHWQSTRRLTFILLLVWTFVTFGCAWFARELNEMTFLGFPLGFYMSAQGDLVVYLFIIGWYNRQMNKLDARLDDKQR